MLPINSYYAIFPIMHIFVMLFIFAIGFSGYSSAAHAFGHEFCDKSIEMQHGQHDHHDHQKDADTKKFSSKDKCLDCCTSQVMSLHDFKSVFLPQHSVLELTYVDLLRIGDFLYSLKRPPKSFV